MNPNNSNPQTIPGWGQGAAAGGAPVAFGSGTQGTNAAAAAQQQYQAQMLQAQQQAQAARIQAANPQVGQMPQVVVQPVPAPGTQMSAGASGAAPAAAERGFQAFPGTTQPQMIMPTPAANAAPAPGVSAAGASNAVGANNPMAAQSIGSAAPAQTVQMVPQKDSPNSTQASILISELRDNVVIMKDGSFRAVVACKSINFDLMSDVEREGVEYSYQNFLNSLEFTTQILIRSQRVDIGPYIERLAEIRRNNDNMLLGVLMDDYISFIDILSQEANIMDKSFFIVIPYYSSAEAEKDLQQTKNFFKTFSRSKGPEITRINRETYDKALAELMNRVDSVISGLFQIGISSVRLNTKELAELYYNFNNPDTAVREPLVDFSKVATMYVKKGEKKDE